MRKGIILAGGTASRLFPATLAISKQILPVHDKPMIYYPISTLMTADIRDILIISTPRDLPLFRQLLGTGKQFGVKFSYQAQKQPGGIAQSLIIAQDYLAGDKCVLILGDNIFYGPGFAKILQQANIQSGATIFTYNVTDPQRYGLVEFDKNSLAIRLEEKPIKPFSNNAITGLYFYDQMAVQYAKYLKPSARGELEITDVNKLYLSNQNLYVQPLPKGFAWLDMGTHQSLMDSSQFIATIEKRQAIKIGCLEEIAFEKKWIDLSMIKHAAKKMSGSSYGEYLGKLANKDI